MTTQENLNATELLKELREVKEQLHLLAESLNFEPLIEALRELRRRAEQRDSRDEADEGDDFCPGEDDDESDS